MLIHPTVERLRTLGLSAMADAFTELQNAPEAAELPPRGLARPARRSRGNQPGEQAPRPAPARGPAAAVRGRRRRRLRMPRAGSTAPCSSSSPRANGSAIITICPRRADRHRQVMAGLCPRPQGLPRGLLGTLQARGAGCSAILPRRAAKAGCTRLLTTLERTRLLIIDDWGPEPLNAEQRRDLLEIVDDRYDKGSLLITSQVPVSRWHEVIGDPTLADAILDRIVHRAHRIELKGDPCAAGWLQPKARLHDQSCGISRRTHSRLPTRAVPSLVKARRAARGSPPWTPWTILYCLTGITGVIQLVLVSTAQIADTPHADIIGGVVA